jgi:DNA-binding NtrC family response regulator
MKIIVADDDYSNRRPLVVYLQRRGHFVIETSSAEQAILAFDTNPDTVAVITDLEMEKPLSGLDVLSHIRSTRREVELCLVSGSLSPETTRKAEELEAFVLAKPFGLSELCQKLGL